MTRYEELQKVKELITDNLENAEYGIYNVNNVVGDEMDNLFSGEFFTLDICYGYGYYELFGTNKPEWEELKDYYDKEVTTYRKAKWQNEMLKGE